MSTCEAASKPVAGRVGAALEESLLDEGVAQAVDGLLGQVQLGVDLGHRERAAGPGQGLHDQQEPQIGRDARGLAHGAGERTRPGASVERLQVRKPGGLLAMN
jgi:hypothetical protein